MSTKESCKNCQHCLSCQGSSNFWCRLRKIKVHVDVAPFAVCHHWTKKSPTLPKFEDKAIEVFTERQLEISRSLSSIES